MKVSGIYKIQSIVKPERIYIGSGQSIYKRWGDHLYLLRRGKHHSKKLQNHYNKYGEADLQFSILLGCEIEDLLRIEQYFIDSYNPWFNNCKIAGSTLGIKRNPRSEEWRRKQSISQKGRKQSPETIAKQVAKRIGREVKPETREKIRQSLMGRKRPKEIFEKMWITRRNNISEVA